MPGRNAAIFAGCLVVAAAARAELDVTIRNGDSVRGTILPAAETETFRFLCPRGAKLTVSAASRGTKMRVGATLFAPDGTEAAGAAGRRIRLKGVLAAESGLFRLDVSSADGRTTGDYALDVRWRAPRSFAATASVAANATSELEFAADTGTRVSFSLATPHGSGAAPSLLRVRAVSGALFQLQAGTKGTFVVPATGSYAMTFRNAGAATGAVVARATVRSPKAATRRLSATSREILSGTDVVASKVIDGTGGFLAGPQFGALARTLVTVPPQALRRAAIVVLGTSPDVDAPGDASFAAATPPAFVGPLGTTFSAALPTVDLPLLPDDGVPSEAQLRVYAKDRTGAEGVVAGAASNGSTVRFAPSRFARFQGRYVVGADGAVLLPYVDGEKSDRASGPVAMGGGFAFVGSPQDGDDMSYFAIAEGLVRVFERQGPSWVERGTLRSPTTAWGDGFGIAVAYRASPLGPADDSLLVAARYDNGLKGSSSTDPPVIFEFTRSGSEWTYLRQLPAVETFAFAVDGDTFHGLTADLRGVATLVRGPQGWSPPGPPIALSHSVAAIDVRGPQMLLGDVTPDADGSHGSGSAFRYVLSGGAAFQAVRYDAPPPLQDGTRFGTAVYLGADYAAVARPDFAAGVSMFRRSGDALDATLTLPVLPGHAGSPSAYTGFAMNGDTVVLAAGTDIRAKPLVGGFVFRRTAGEWAHRFTLDATASLHVAPYKRAMPRGIGFDGSTVVMAVDLHLKSYVQDTSAVVFFDLPQQ